MNKSCKILAFLLPVVPWVLVLILLVVGWILDDPWLAFALAACLLIPTLILMLVCSISGVACALRCWRQMGHKRYWIAFALGVVTLCFGGVWLFRLLRAI